MPTTKRQAKAQLVALAQALGARGYMRGGWVQNTIELVRDYVDSSTLLKRKGKKKK